MSIAEVEQREFSEEPFGSTDTPAGLPVPSVDVYAEDTHFADLFTGNPTLAQQVWEGTAQDILDTDFDPRAIYLEAFRVRVAARNGTQSIDMPTQPTAEVLDKLGATSLYVHATRGYYKSTRSID